MDVQQQGYTMNEKHLFKMICNSVKTVRVCGFWNETFNLLQPSQFRETENPLQWCRWECRDPSLPTPTRRVICQEGQEVSISHPAPSYLLLRWSSWPLWSPEVSFSRSPLLGWEVPPWAPCFWEYWSTLIFAPAEWKDFHTPRRQLERLEATSHSPHLKWGCQTEVGHCPHSQFKSADSVILLWGSREPGKRNLGVASLGKNKYPTT